ncbi:hypothetical protein HAX54_008184 [Datura stramonium]|uniref:Uncharacterized protein n=1 Tax=Datura stramonium TaxID=4076 RepID=A0ABS8TE38_DATST|nr:hypothetical protein [Datura stramonium]
MLILSASSSSSSSSILSSSSSHIPRTLSSFSTCVAVGAKAGAATVSSAATSRLFPISCVGVKLRSVGIRKLRCAISCASKVRGMDEMLEDKKELTSTTAAAAAAAIAVSASENHELPHSRAFLDARTGEGQSSILRDELVSSFSGGINAIDAGGGEGDGGVGSGRRKKREAAIWVCVGERVKEALVEVRRKGAAPRVSLPPAEERGGERRLWLKEAEGASWVDLGSYRRGVGLVLIVVLPLAVQWRRERSFVGWWCEEVVVRNGKMGRKKRRGVRRLVLLGGELFSICGCENYDVGEGEEERARGVSAAICEELFG